MLPFISVVMPIRNEAAFIARSLGAVLAQDYPPERYEVVVVDGMSTDRTRTIVQQLAAAAAVPVQVVDNPARIVPPAMNLGLRAARGDIIVRMDGHTVAAPDYLSQCVAALARTGADNVGGRMDCVSETPLGEAIALATSSPFGIGNAKFHYATTEQEVDTVYLGCWRREAFTRFGLFDEYFTRTQDSEFNYRTRLLGGRIYLCPAIRSQYYNRASLGKLARQYFEYGFWKTRLMYKLGGRLLPRHFAAPALVLGLLGAVGLLGVGAFWAQPWLIGLGLCPPLVYGLGAAGAATWLAAKARRPGLWPLLVAVFAVLHLSWGSGFLLGLVRRPHRSCFGPLPTPAGGTAR